jgi:chromate transport protein ChrA
MCKTLRKLFKSKGTVILQTFLAVITLVAMLASASFADIVEEVEAVGNTFSDVMSPIAGILGVLLILGAIGALFQKNWGLCIALIIASILLIKLKDFMVLFSGA